MTQGRAIPAAYWISYFMLHWLLILGVIEQTNGTSATVVYFLLTALISSFMVAAHERMESKK